jgi:hypothetical protein
LPWRVRARASWRVTEDFPTPPLPDNTYKNINEQQFHELTAVVWRLYIDLLLSISERGSESRLTSTMFFTPSRGIACKCI